MQKLSKRLQAAADFVTPGNRVADIGTDHGFLPVYLVQSGRCPAAAAMDLREGPLKRAQEHIEEAGLAGRIQVRLSDGMQMLSEGEADSVVIAGMGGLTVIQILSEGLNLLPGLKELVLGPQSDIAKVRRWLREHNIYIDKEDLVLETGKFYPVLHAVMQKPQMDEAYQKNRERMLGVLKKKLADELRIRQLLDQYGECPVFGKHPGLVKLLERDRERETEILRHLAAGKEAALDKNSEEDSGKNFEKNFEEKEDRRIQREREAKVRLEETEVLLEVLKA